MTTWYVWVDEPAFTLWHDNTCAAERIPYPGRNQHHGDLDPDAEWTRAYVTPSVFTAPDGTHVIAPVPDGPHNASLEPLPDPPSAGLDEPLTVLWEGETYPVEPAAFDYYKELPPLAQQRPE